MTKDEAMELLESPLSSERLRGARGLQLADLGPEDRERLEVRLVGETDAWVQTALRGVLQPRLSLHSTAEHAEVVDAQTLSEIQAQATEQVTRLVLHEIRPIVGSLDRWAQSEIDNYADSRTARSMGHLNRLLDALVALNEASSAPVVAEFDMTAVIGECALEMLEHARLSFGRADSLIAVGDQRLLSLALVNCLRNAVEATEPLKDSAGPVVINWGATELDFWVAILDEGIGLPKSSDRLTDPGITTKTKDGGHFGIGLTIVQRAMHTLGGRVELTPREHRGASAELRWPRPGEAV